MRHDIFLEIYRKDKRPQDWSAKERIDAIINAASIPDEKLGAWCRKKGLHTNHLQRWREEFSKEQNGSQTAKIRELKKDIKLLQKNLDRKDKALAETTALLVLKKKVQLLWDEKEDD